MSMTDASAIHNPRRAVVAPIGLPDNETLLDGGSEFIRYLRFTAENPAERLAFIDVVAYPKAKSDARPGSKCTAIIIAARAKAKIDKMAKTPLIDSQQLPLVGT
jgi:hypothetical protein